MDGGGGLRDWTVEGAGLSTKEQMGHDKLTATWRRASSLLASFDDELA